ENAGSVDLIGIEVTDLNQFLDLGDADFATGGDHRIKIPRCLSVNEVPEFIAFPCFDDGKLGGDPGLEHIISAVEVLCLFAFGEFGAETRPRVKSRNSGATGSQSFRKGALRNQ